MCLIVKGLPLKHSADNEENCPLLWQTTVSNPLRINPLEHAYLTTSPILYIGGTTTGIKFPLGREGGWRQTTK